MATTETPRCEPPPSWDAARRQAALVRALTYELERHPAVGAAEAIRSQLTEEVARLASHIEETSAVRSQAPGS